MWLEATALQWGGQTDEVKSVFAHGENGCVFLGDKMFLAVVRFQGCVWGPELLHERDRNQEIARWVNKARPLSDAWFERICEAWDFCCPKFCPPPLCEGRFVLALLEISRSWGNSVWNLQTGTIRSLVESWVHTRSLQTLVAETVVVVLPVKFFAETQEHANSSNWSLMMEPCTPACHTAALVHLKTCMMSTRAESRGIKRTIILVFFEPFLGEIFWRN